MSEKTVQGEKPLLVVLDGGAFKGSVQPGLISYLQEKNVKVRAYAGISIGSLISTLVCNNRSQEEMREFMLEHFIKGMWPTSVIPPLLQPSRLLFGGVVDQVPIMRKVVREFDLSPQANLRIVAFDLLSGTPFVFQGEDYDLATALAASCSPYPIIRPVQHVDSDGKLRMLVDACVYLTHKRIFDDPTLIARIFPVRLRKPEQDEFPVMIGYPHGKIIRRPSAKEYDKYWQHGYASAERQLAPLLQMHKLPVRELGK